MKYPILKVVSMDERREFVEQLYEAGYTITGYGSSSAGWTYFMEAVGANDEEYVYWGVSQGKLICIHSFPPSYALLVNSPAQFFVYLKHMSPAK